MTRARILLAGSAYSALLLALTIAFGVGSYFVMPFLKALPPLFLQGLMFLFVLVTYFLAARLVARRFGPASRTDWLRVGGIGFLLLVVADWAAWILIWGAPIETILRHKFSLVSLVTLLFQAIVIIFPALAAGWDRTRS